MISYNFKDTIVALSTAKGVGAIAVIRLSGPAAIEMIEKHLFTKTLKKITLNKQVASANLFCLIVDQNEAIDEVLVNTFIAPKSYTGEDCVEVSCHGSTFIQQRLLQLFLNTGARMAEPGEFTLRAFMNKKFDLSQAEAVADLIASNSEASHRIALKQMRGGFSQKIKLLRNDLINFASLIELELDFSEEDVEFANRDHLNLLLNNLIQLITHLVNSFEIGNVLKNGVPVAIVGKPNAGKSTLLNALLQEDRAIVSEIPGTTRDTIEAELNINGILFRFIDTAGLRTTDDHIEKIGIHRTYDSISKAAIVIYLFDVNELNSFELNNEIKLLRNQMQAAKLLLVGNKIDETNGPPIQNKYPNTSIVFISALEQINITDLKKILAEQFEIGNLESSENIVTNARHANSLKIALDNLQIVKEGVQMNLSGELLAQNIRLAIQTLGLITGEVSSDDLLGNIFSKFCIGK